MVTQKALTHTGLLEILDVLVDELTNDKILPKLDPKQKKDLIDNTIEDIKKSCGSEEAQGNDALNINLDHVHDHESVKNLMDAFKVALMAELATNPKLEPKADKKQEPAYSALFKETPTSDQAKLKDKLKLDIKAQLVLMLTEIMKKQPQPQMTPQQVDKLADKMAEKLAMNMTAKIKDDAREEEDLLAKNRAAVDHYAELGMAMACLFGTNPLMPGSNPPVVMAVLGNLFGIPDLAQSGGMNYMSIENTLDTAPSADSRNATLTNAISAGATEEISPALDKTIHSAMHSAPAYTLNRDSNQG